MENDDKPFECTVQGCGQRFANNDHLAVHKQKHQLTLSLGPPRIGENSLIEDQTPTPTRFLKNLDETGIFADLDRDNPFDQEFKRASHSEQNGKAKPRTEENPSNPAPPSTVIVVDQSEPVITQALSSAHLQLITSSNNEAMKLSHTLPVHSIMRNLPAAIPASIANPNIPVPTAHSAISTNNHTVPLQIPSITNISTLTAAAVVSSPNSNTASFMGSAKQRLKESLRQQSNANTNNIISRAMTEAASQMMDHMTTNSQDTSSMNVENQDGKKAVKRTSRRSQEDLDPDTRRKKFLERNRAAATRCREKRKIWVTQLEKKAEDLTQTNSQLQSEIALLRTEVAQLKALLLAHKECPVTLQQQKMGGLVQAAGQLINIHGNNPSFLTLPTSLAEDTAKTALIQMATQNVSTPSLPEGATVTVVTLPQ